MSARRYRIQGCRCWPPSHFVAVFPDGYERIVDDIPTAYRRIAEEEARRLAGDDWLLVGEAECVVVQRLYRRGRPTWGSYEPVRFESWARVARMLADVRAAQAAAEAVGVVDR